MIDHWRCVVTGGCPQFCSCRAHTRQCPTSGKRRIIAQTTLEKWESCYQPERNTPQTRALGEGIRLGLNIKEATTFGRRKVPHTSVQFNNVTARMGDGEVTQLKKHAADGVRHAEDPDSTGPGRVPCDGWRVWWVVDMDVRTGHQALGGGAGHGHCKQAGRRAGGRVRWRIGTDGMGFGLRMSRGAGKRTEKKWKSRGRKSGAL